MEQCPYKEDILFMDFVFDLQKDEWQYRTLRDAIIYCKESRKENRKRDVFNETNHSGFHKNQFRYIVEDGDNNLK